jgi:hypothetical protein
MYELVYKQGADHAQTGLASDFGTTAQRAGGPQRDAMPRSDAGRATLVPSTQH